MADTQIEQFDTPEQTAERLALAEANAEDWWGRMTTAAATANGAGLIALSGFVVSRDLRLELIAAAAVAGLVFLTGLVLSGAGMAASYHRHTLAAKGYANKLQQNHIEVHFAPAAKDRRHIDAFQGVLRANAALIGTESHEADRDRADFVGWGFRWFGVGFLIAFMTVVASTLWRPPANKLGAETKRCLAIQRDMLSARPRRPDGPDLFQALGCRPQGEGSVYAAPEQRRG